MSDVKITVLENGPFKVQGAIELVDAEGAQIEVKKDTVFLCRCGASVNKPFCDGQHSKIGFKSAAQAVPESAE
jgi:3-phenylpropionate/trans-cinnamate dioxygenase ferredoxin subunit